MMKPITTSLALACLALLGGNGLAEAQGAPAPVAENPLAFGVNAFVGIPTGDGSDAVDAAIGVLATVDFRLQPQLELTGRAGYLHWLVDGDTASIYQIPVWVGARFFLQPGGQGVFIHGESGINSLHSSVEIFGVTASSSETELALNLLGGFRQGKLVVEGGLYIVSLDEADDSIMIGGTIGTSF